MQTMVHRANATEVGVIEGDVMEASRVGPGHAFLIGQDRAGHWLAIETHGLGGGLFASRDAALGYARAETGRRPGAIQIAPQPITLRHALPADTARAGRRANSDQGRPKRNCLI